MGTGPCCASFGAGRVVGDHGSQSRPPRQRVEAVVDGQRGLHGQESVGIEEGDADRERVYDAAHGEQQRRYPALRLGEAAAQQPPVTGGVQPQSGPGACVRRHRHGVDDRRGPLALASSQCLAQDPGGEGQEGDCHEEQQVQVHQPTVHTTEMTEDGVVVEPHDPDHREADDISGQRWPTPGQVVSEVAVVLRFGNGYDEERDGKCEDAIAERFDA